MLVKDGCSSHGDINSKLQKYCVVENERTTRTRVGERGMPEVEGQVKGSSAHKERDDVMQLG